MNTEITVLKEIVAVRLDVHIWSARKKLTPTDFGSANLPPEKIASLGSKRICDPVELRIFGTLKGKAVCLLDKKGVRFLGGWAISESVVHTVQTDLQTIAANFQAAKEAFLHRYDDTIRGWILDNPGWEALLSTSIVRAEYVRERLSFDWQMFRVVPPRKDRKAEVQRGLEAEVRSLGATLFGEVAKVASDAWHKSFAGKTAITRKALSPLRAIQRKLAGLIFVEPRVAPVVELLEVALGRLPASGGIEGAELVMLQGLVRLLGDPDALVEHGQKVLEGRKPEAILSGLIDSAAPSTLGSVSSPEPSTSSDKTAPLPSVPVSMPGVDSLGLW